MGAVAAAGGGRRELGAHGEGLAAAAYRRSGYDVVDRNWRCGAGEIDLVCLKGPTLVFCEVKTRSSARFGTGEEAVTVGKQRRVRRLAALWLREHRMHREHVRFDVASVAGDQVSIVEGAF